MPKIVWKAQYYMSILSMAVPLSAYLLGRKVQALHDEDLSHFRNKSQLFGGRKESVW